MGEPSHNLNDPWIPAVHIMCGSQRAITTECGYHNAIFGNYSGVSEGSSRKYLPRLFLEYFNRDVERTYSYELIDIKPNPDNDQAKFHFGLLRNDGSPKTAFIALRNLIMLLRDPNAVASVASPLGSLDYGFSGDATSYTSYPAAKTGWNILSYSLASSQF
ncbi:MAG: hypothetical protein QNJ46_05270 [Leptolyngbyaceae cyanobacterium MO_188.B28]|nr:hypothetical protein [Leptolyngbyaceae cyanobacterium MO_188.B28]